MAQPVIWVIDTSSIIEVRRLGNQKKPKIFEQLGALVQAGRLVFPKEVVNELKRAASTDSPDDQHEWAKRWEAEASQHAPSFEQVKDVLSRVSRVLDPDKDTGVEEADPYVLAMASRLRGEGKDARIVTQEIKDTPRKMSLSTAAGVLGLASVPLKAFLEFEGIDS